MRDAIVRLVLVGLIVTGAACSSSPTVLPSPTSPSPAPAPTDPSPAPPTFHLAGVWTGFMKITEIAGTAPTEVGTIFPFTLRIAGGPQSYTGQFELAQYPAFHLNVGVAGALRDDGFVILSGTTTFDALDVTSAEVSELIVKTDDTTGLTGTVRFGERLRRSSSRFTAQIVSASLQSSTAYPGGALEGHWIGEVVIKECTGYCRLTVGFTRKIELILRQSGTTLSGRGTFGSLSCSGGCWLPLAGSADGHAIASLTGQLRQPFYPDQLGDYFMTLSDFSATADDLGRMRARFIYSVESKAQDPNDYFGRIDVASRLAMETVWLTRQP